MRGKSLALVGMVVIAVALVVAALIYVRPRGIRVTVRHMPAQTLRNRGWSQDSLRVMDLHEGGFDITLDDGKCMPGTILSPAKLKTFAQFTQGEGDWLNEVFRKWAKLTEPERAEALAEVTRIIKRSIERHGGSLDEYMDERMGLLRADEEKKTEIKGIIRKLDWRNFPVRGVAVEYTPELIPCEPVPRATPPSRARTKSPVPGALGLSVESWALWIIESPSGKPGMVFNGKVITPDDIEGLTDKQRARLRELLKDFDGLSDKEISEIFDIIPQKYYGRSQTFDPFPRSVPSSPLGYFRGALIIGEPDRKATPEDQDSHEKQPEESK